MDNYIGEIRIFPYNNIPSKDGWMPCNGQTLLIMQNQVLFSLIGTYYGGNGTTNFMLPNLNGRTIIGYGIRQSPLGILNYFPGETGGAESVPITLTTMPIHNHSVLVKNSYDTSLPGTNFIGNPNIPTDNGQQKKNTSSSLLYTQATSGTGSATCLHPLSVSNTGGNGKHENRMPFLALKYCIATKGVYPHQPY